MIGNNGSFGGNTLVESIGLLDAKSVDRLTVTWPTSKTTQTFRDLAADQAIEITEGAEAISRRHEETRCQAGPVKRHPCPRFDARPGAGSPAKPAADSVTPLPGRRRAHNLNGMAGEIPSRTDPVRLHAGGEASD